MIQKFISSNPISTVARCLRIVVETTIEPGALEKHGHLRLDEAVREKPLCASAATIDRLLSNANAGVRGSARRRPRAKTAVQRLVPFRTFADWKDPTPGQLLPTVVQASGEEALRLARCKAARGTHDTCAKLLAAPSIEHEMKERLRGVGVSLDPLRLLDEIRSMQRSLASLSSGLAEGIVPARDPDLEKFLSSLATAWQEGEVRPTHRVEPRSRRYWRTRPDPFETVCPASELGWM